ncbi:MAG: hypothetical protein HYU39_05125 [Thaumarchaeota archaeon]|nr:hypothetical protein [Nitrososphaerota archaeon]
MFLSVFLAVALAAPILFLTVQPYSEKDAPPAFQSTQVAQSAEKSLGVSRASVNETRQQDAAPETSKTGPAVTSPPPNPPQPLLLLAASLVVGLTAYGLVKRLQP